MVILPFEPRLTGVEQVQTVITGLTRTICLLPSVPFTPHLPNLRYGRGYKCMDGKWYGNGTRQIWQCKNYRYHLSYRLFGSLIPEYN
jgi:hypothetical protein